MDEQEKIDKIRQVRVIVTEVLMMVSVVALVWFLTLIVMGYSFHLGRLGSEEGEVVERTGLLQISSVPTGASITIDGGTPLLLRTNASRTMTAGEHEIVLTKDGYGAWSKKVNIVEGMMSRVSYPRLFLTERTSEEVLDTKKVTFFSVAPNKEEMLILNDGKFRLVEINVNKPTTTTVSFPETLGLPEKIETVKEIGWSGNSEKILALVNGEYFVLNIEKPEESLKLKKELKIRQVEFENESGERLLILDEEGSLREFVVKTATLGEKLLDGVLKFDNDGEKVVYLGKVQVEAGVAEASEGSTETTVETSGTGTEKRVEVQARAYLVGDEESYKIRTVGTVEEVDPNGVFVASMRYFQELYFAVVNGGVMKVYQAANWPEGETEIEKVFQGEIGFLAKKLEKRGKGMVFSLEDESGKEKAVFNIEFGEMKKFSIQGENGWVDEFLRFEVNPEGELFVADFDGENWRKMGEGIETRGMTISGNNKWMYYFKNGTLVREKIS